MVERVLITGARAPAALDLARSFAAAGFEVHMADCVSSFMARWSRTPARTHRYPSPRADATAFKQSLDGIVAKIDPVLVIPACEEVFHLSAQGIGGKRLFAPPISILRRLHSKLMFAEDCIAAGLSAPATTRISSKVELEAFLPEAADLVFKPEYSRFGTQALIAPKAASVRAINPSPSSPWVAQTRVRGAEVCFYAASVGSRLAAFSAYKSTWRLGGGASYVFEPVEAGLFDQLREVAAVMAARLVPQGQFACDVITDEAGQPWLIECNPRATSGVHLFGRSPNLALAMLGQFDDVAVGTRSSAHVGPALWWYGGREAIRRKRMGEWQTRRRSGNDVISAPGDRAPVLGALADTMAFGARAFFNGQSLTEIMTADIEWNGEEL